MSRPLDGPRPALQTPPLATDTHMHFYLDGFAGQPGGPPPPEPATIADYAVVQKRLGLERTVIVQPNAYQANNSCLLACLEAMGESARAVAVVTPETSEAELERMHALGVRGARIMQLPGGAVGIAQMQAVEAKVAPLGWHLIVQFDGRDLALHEAALRGLRGTYIIDHIGKFLEPVSPGDPSFTGMLKLLDRGNCYVKLAGCYETSRSGAPRFEDVGALARGFVAHAPERIVWGSNWPHVGVGSEDYPDDAHLLDVLADWTDDDEVLQQILVDTPARLYEF